MREEELKNLLSELVESSSEPVRAGLAEEIKQQIPGGLMTHSRAMNTVSIIIDLRINRLVAAAVIIIAMILMANFFAGRYSGDGNIFQQSSIFLRYLMGTDKDMAVTVRSRYELLADKGLDVVYYGLDVDSQDSNSILMHWKVSGGKYKVLFSDLREEEVSAEELIKLQAQMLQK